MKVMRIFERLEKVRRPTQRCKSRFVGLESHDSSYITMGQRANRGGPGVLNSKMNLLKSREKQLVVRFVRQIKEVFRRWVDWSVVFGFSVTRQVQGFPSLSCKNKESTFFSSIAFGRNVFLGAYTDEDFGYSVVVAMAVDLEKAGDSVPVRSSCSRHHQVIMAG